ncbi:MAG TPA: hypothetical protein VMA34_04385 [Terracidiphilus sp.]|nr:hypothetical protein [Terracidiphilus sp.]
MHPLYRRLNPKQRRLFKIANAALVLGLAPWIFRESIHFNHDWLDAFCGFFLGLYITINLFCLRAARGCRERQM